MHMMKISVIVPVYNVEAYLDECILSVLHQTYRNFEIILIDDGSTDFSGKICDELALKYPDQIVSIHQNNQGALSARITGISKSRGDILVFLDSDDSLRKDALEVISRCFDTKQCDMVLFDAGTCEEYSTRTITHSLDDTVEYQEGLSKLLYEKIIAYQIPNSICLKAIRKEVIIYPDYLEKFYSVKHGEDLLMSVYLMTNCRKIVYLPQGLYHYRMRSGSVVHTFDPERRTSIKTVHIELDKFIQQWGMPELKPLHNTRKVNGWVETLVLLLENRDKMTKSELQDHLQSMAEDPYFLSAHANMDSARLSRLYRLLANCLAKRKYELLHIISIALPIIRKIKSRSKYVR